MNTANYYATKRAAVALEHSRTAALQLMLVYQAGIANVFQVEDFAADVTDDDPGCNNAKRSADRVAKRIYQGDFRTAETLCYGAALAGAIIRSAACNMAGDVSLWQWTRDLDVQPFSDKFHPQAWN